LADDPGRRIAQSDHRTQSLQVMTAPGLIDVAFVRANAGRRRSLSKFPAPLAGAIVHTTNAAGT